MPSPRAVWVAFGGLVVGIAVIVSLFAWPGYYSALS